MIDIRKYIDVFVITNGRSSFDYVIKSLYNQIGVKLNVHVIENETWLDACNTCLEYSDKPYYFRLDDDMLLSPFAIWFFHKTVEQFKKKDIIVYNYKLWEPWNNRLCGGVKLYVRLLAKKIGFEIDSRGKVDKIFKKKAIQNRYRYVGDRNSAIAIHAACSYEDNEAYSILRGEYLDPTYRIRETELIKLDSIFNKIPLNKQLEMSKEELNEYNINRNTNFGLFIRARRGEQCGNIQIFRRNL